MDKKRKGNKEGSVRLTKEGTYEAVIQSSYLNPDTSKPKRFKRRGATEAEALKKAKLAMRAWEKEFRRVGNNVKISKTKTLGDYMIEWLDSELKGQIADSTYRGYVKCLDIYFNKYPISKLQLNMIDTHEFETYFDRLTHEMSYKSIKLPISLCKRLSTYLYGKSLFEEDYAQFAKVKRQKKDEFNRKEANEREATKEFFTPEDIVRFYNAYKDGISEYAVVAMLQLETFMRASEILSLYIEDVNFEENLIRVRNAIGVRYKDNDKSKGSEYYIKLPKNEKDRIIPLSPLAREIVERMIFMTKNLCRSNPEGLLFPSFIKSGKMRATGVYEAQFVELCQKLGIERGVHIIPETGRCIGLGTHSLRHTGITMANTCEGANVFNTALMAGHSIKRLNGINIGSEATYTHSDIEALRRVKTPSMILGLGASKPDKKEEANKMLEKLKEDKELMEAFKSLLKEV